MADETVNITADLIDHIGEAVGKEDVVLLNKIEESKIRRYNSTQSLPLDLAVGRPGVPSGRLTVIRGPESQGKCLGADSVIFSEDGILTVEELFKKHLGYLPEEESSHEVCINLVNRFGKLEKTSHFMCNGKKKLKKIKTKTGYVLKSTPNHPWLVSGEDGCLRWKNMEDIEEGDYLVFPRSSDLKALHNLNYSYEKVTDILGYGETVPVYDFTLPETHSFIADGAICHNSTLAYHILAQTQQDGGVAVLFDAERALDEGNVPRLKRIGLDVDSLVLVHKDTMEEYFQSCFKIIDATRNYDKTIPITIVWDSITSSPTNQDLSKKDVFNDLGVGNQARVISASMRKIMSTIAGNNVAFVVINQLRENIGFFGAKEVMPGGKALGYYASVIIRIGSVGQPYQDEKGVDSGIECITNIQKNKIAPPFKEATLRINYYDGIDKEHGYYVVARDLGIVKEAGSWFEFTDEYKDFYDKKFRSRDWKNVINDEVKEVIYKTAWEKVRQ